MGPRWVAVGRIVRTHGTKGAVKAVAYGETLPGARPGDPFFVALPGRSLPRKLTVEKITAHGSLWRIRFCEIKGMEAARGLVDCEIGVPEDRLPKPGRGEYYHYQLTGIRVHDVGGEEIGRVCGVLETGAHDVYVVQRPGGKEVLVPAVEDVVLRIDVDEGTMEVRLPEGLLDDL